jgi:hypothetical protein
MFEPDRGVKCGKTASCAPCAGMIARECLSKNLEQMYTNMSLNILVDHIVLILSKPREPVQGKVVILDRASCTMRLGIMTFYEMLTLGALEKV